MKLHKSWKDPLSKTISLPYFKNLLSFLREERKSNEVFPAVGQIFAAFDMPFAEVSVVILGQDPYHQPGQANGLAFSVNTGVRPPPSLRNILKEVKDDTGCVYTSDNLKSWTTQGVLLLNTTLSVIKDNPLSHFGKGWEIFTADVIKEISARLENVVFMLWGKNAAKKAYLIEPEKHLILQAPHPSPLSVHSGFFGCKHFSKANEYLKLHGKCPVKW